MATETKSGTSLKRDSQKYKSEALALTERVGGPKTAWTPQNQFILGESKTSSERFDLGLVQEAHMNGNHKTVAIEVTDLCKKYSLYDLPQHRLLEALHPFRKKYHQDFWALRNISFDVMQGETVGIVGNNGCGKSTLLKIITGILTPTSGSTTVCGRLAALLELGSGFNLELTGRENVYMSGSLLGIDKDEMKSRLPEIIAFADIGEFIDQPVRMYSSGMFVRLAFSVSICIDPDILIVDEALSVGDAAFQFKCMGRLDKITKSGTTLLFVSHDMGAIKSFCNKVIYLRNGAIRDIGTPDVISEMYLLDMRHDLVRDQSRENSVKQKQYIGESHGMAFGTDQGSISRAEFVSTGGHVSSFITGDIIELEVDVEYLDSVRFPSLSISIHDRKMLLITSSYAMIRSLATNNGMNSSTLKCSFRASLGEGRYFVTVKLDDRPSDTVFTPIDKQVGLLSFEVLQPKNTRFKGVMDLSLSIFEENPEV